MKRWLWLGLTACCAAALAQQPGPDDDRVVPGEVESAAVAGAAQDAGRGSEDDAPESVSGEADGEAAGEPEGEFTPTEEIPEDYPVPLPSDI